MDIKPPKRLGAALLALAFWFALLVLLAALLVWAIITFPWF